MSETREELLQRTYQVREGYLRQLGEVDPLVLAPVVNPAELGKARWPDLRQAFRVIRKDGRTTVVSDGLADPFDNQIEPNVGFGIEILLESADPIDGSVQNNWPFWVVYDVARQAAHHGGFRELIDELSLLSMEIQCRFGPENLATSAGHLGLLLGIQPPQFSTEWVFPAGKVRVITVKVLHPEELAVAVKDGDAGRDRLRHLFAADGSYHVSSAARPSVVQ